MKKSLHIIIFLALCWILCLSPAVFAAEGNTVTVDGINYVITTMPNGGNNGTVMVGDNQAYSGDSVNIPGVIVVTATGENDGAYDVVGIGDGAFAGCTNLKTVTLQEGLTTIGSLAFANSGVTSVTIPESVMRIGDEAFAGCTNLGSVTLQEGLTTIGSRAFEGSGLVKIDLPTSVQSIGAGAFANCGSLESCSYPLSRLDIIFGAGALKIAQSSGPLFCRRECRFLKGALSVVAQASWT